MQLTYIPISWYLVAIIIVLLATNLYFDKKVTPTVTDYDKNYSFKRKVINMMAAIILSVAGLDMVLTVYRMRI